MNGGIDANIAMFWFALALGMFTLATLFWWTVAAQRTRRRAGELVAPAVRLVIPGRTPTKSSLLIALGGGIMPLFILARGVPALLVFLLACVSVACILVGIYSMRSVRPFVLELRTQGMVYGDGFTRWSSIRSATWITDKPEVARLRLQCKDSTRDFQMTPAAKEVVQPILDAHSG